MRFAAQQFCQRSAALTGVVDALVAGAGIGVAGVDKQRTYR